ncbi:polyketide cyclase/dehydrase domain-containing protein [Variovorax paradoxus B4]|uniref:Polyketide cyclase/dehydrase domain-containing protein n=1 Tax=Variovorax paradoxus B4 TaxID=1246301 RepID=T1X9N3_VARPD|nr:SRPBCC family protein [Variovorax paradoxus]AGU48885.1 polyketide cyclase/dehydrase domain-containing protein [Variovorax paradoxus B4]
MSIEPEETRPHELPPIEADASQMRDMPKRRMPFAWFWPLLVGAAVALVLRIAFSGLPGQRFSAMLGSFIYLAPAVCGAVTVYMAERTERRSWGYCIWAPWVSTALFVVGTLLVFIEGMICAIVIVPLFSVMGSLGGLAMGIVCRITNWPRPALYSFALLPLVFGAIEPRWSNPEQISSTSRTLFIAAPAERVWHELNDARDIRPGEVGDAWAYRIGVPMPVAGVTEDTPEGRVRKVQWQKDVHFDEIITEWQPLQRVKWRYRFSPDSFPAGALDDHVVIGGHYFDLRDSAYTLTPREGGTELRIDVSWRVSTRFNWYADRVAQFLLGDFSEHILRFYKARSETAAAAA